jgi:hypothetical protein
MEYLGLPTENLMREVDSIEKEIGNKIPVTSLDQTQAFRLRNTFARGDLAGLQNLMTGNLQGQARWTAIWIKEVLSLRGNELNDTGFPFTDSGLLQETAGEYQNSFHLQTFLGQKSHLGSARIKDLCDRFYLWTWRWLRNPESISIFQLRRLRNEITSRSAIETLGSEDFQQWRNAFLWIGLFEGKRSSHLFSTVRERQPFHRRADSYYQSEFELLKCLHESGVRGKRRMPVAWDEMPSGLQTRIRNRARAIRTKGITPVLNYATGQITQLR